MTEENQEDFDFDFSIYEQEEKETNQIKDIFKDEKPRITNLRSKYSPSQSMLDLVLIPLRQKIGEYGIKVASFSQELNDLRTFYGCLEEYWSNIKDVFGSHTIKQVRSMKKHCITLLIEASSLDTIPITTHLYLLYYRDKIYMISQRHNLGLEVEKSSFSHYDKAKKGMIE